MMTASIARRCNGCAETIRSIFARGIWRSISVSIATFASVVHVTLMAPNSMTVALGIVIDPAFVAAYIVSPTDSILTANELMLMIVPRLVLRMHSAASRKINNGAKRFTFTRAELWGMNKDQWDVSTTVKLKRMSSCEPSCFSY